VSLSPAWDKPITYSTQVTHESWPKCFRCSRARGAPYPVEYFGIVGREAPRMQGSAYRLIVEVRCTGEAFIEDAGLFCFEDRARRFLNFRRDHGRCKQRVVIESRAAWTPVFEQQACARVFAFAPGKSPVHHGVVYGGPNHRSNRMLETEVRG
jgi:hypothetical protein